MKNVGKNKCVVFIILIRVCIYIYIYISGGHRLFFFNLD